MPRTGCASCVSLLVLIPLSCTLAMHPNQMNHKIKGAIDQARRVLEEDKRGPILQANSVPHRWEDKYLLVEWLTDTLVATQVQALSRLGVQSEQMSKLVEWAAGNNSVYLSFEPSQRCDLIEQREREVESPTLEKTTSGVFGSSTVETKVKSKVPEWVWTAESNFTITALRGKGASPEDRIEITRRTGRRDVVTLTKQNPNHQLHDITSLTGAQVVDIGWVVRTLLPSAGSLQPNFKIDREHAQCTTPRRNLQVEQVLLRSSQLNHWAHAVQGFFRAVQRMADQPPVDLSGVRSITPILPLLRRPSNGAGNTTCVLQSIETNLLLDEASNKLQAMSEALRQPGPSGAPQYPSPDELVFFSSLEADLSIALEYSHWNVLHHRQALDYLEGLIEEQLVAAIGSKVTAVQFAEFTRHHNRKLLKPVYSPKPFSAIIRRSARHSPEGTLSLERSDGDPVSTITATATSVSPMFFQLDASTTVEFGGTRHLHSYLEHMFSTQQPKPLSLVARARQFSSMIVVIGKIVGQDGFDPTHAVLVQNKDELKVPLQLTAIPTPKAFREAVESLSPVQRAFAKEVRALQIESTLFGVLVVQVKPQLEKVLNLPPDSLTKEIALTQQLMSLLVDHEIPSDLLSYHNPNSDTSVHPLGEPLEEVRKHVGAMSGMIDQAKKREAEEREEQKKYEAGATKEADEFLTGTAYSYGGDAEFSRTVPLKAAPRRQVHMASADVGNSVQTEEAHTQEHEPETATRQEGPRGENQASGGGGVDYTRIVAEMDARIEQLDADGALRPTMIDVKGAWRRKSRKGLLGALIDSRLQENEQKEEKIKALGLLDALTRAGGLVLDDAEMHVVVAATHQFDKSIMQTLVQDNVNPIERVERSTLILGSSVHRVPCSALLKPGEVSRVMSSSPMLFKSNHDADDAHAHAHAGNSRQ